MNRWKRILASIRLFTISKAVDRAEYMRKNKFFGMIGENSLIQNRKLPLHSNLIYIHDNVKLASGVEFITHDVIYKMLNEYDGSNDFIEKVGCIEIMNNVFIGTGTRILYNVRIGNNVIVGAGSLVNKDIPDNSVYAGVPARYICSFDEYMAKNKAFTEEFRNKYGIERLKGVSNELAEKLYEDFCKERA